MTQGISFPASKDRHREILYIDIVYTDRSTTLYELELLITRYSDIRKQKLHICYFYSYWSNNMFSTILSTTSASFEHVFILYTAENIVENVDSLVVIY